MKQLVILSGKGGTGKTTVAAALAHLVSRALYNQAAALAEHGRHQEAQALLVEAITYDFSAFSPDYEGYMAHRGAWWQLPSETAE